MSLKSNIDPDPRGFFYADSGKNIWDGKTIELPKKTIQAAIDAAAALSPSPGDTARVKEAQGGVYNETITLANSVLFEGTQTAIITSGAIAVTAADNIRCDLQAAINTSVGGIGLSINGSVSFSANLAAIRALGANGIAVEIKGTVDDIFVKGTQIVLDGDGSIGFKITSSHTTALDINSDVFKFGDINQTFFEYDTVNTTDLCDLNISTVESDSGGGAGGYLGTKGIIVRNGRLKVRIGSLSAKTFVEVESGGRLSIQGNAIGGDTIIKDGGECVYDSFSIIDGNLNTEGTGILQARVSNIIGDATLSGTSSMSIISNQFIGELIVGSSATLFAFIDVYTGTLPPNDGRVNGWIGGTPFGNTRQKPEQEFVLTAFSFNTQSPTAVDTLLQVEFGAAQFGSSDPVQIDILGNITINQTDQYIVSLILQYGRVGAGSFVLLFFRLLVDGVQAGNSIAAKLDNANSNLPVQFSGPLSLSSGQILTIEIWRDSTGFDAGSLFSETPVLGGTNSTPSASISLRRNRLTQPV